MIAFGGLLWACGWFRRNCITVLFYALFSSNKCIIAFIPLSTTWWIWRISLLVYPLEPSPAPHPITPCQSVSLSIPLINSIMYRFWVDGFNLWSFVQRRTCKFMQVGVEKQAWRAECWGQAVEETNTPIGDSLYSKSSVYDKTTEACVCFGEHDKDSFDFQERLTLSARVGKTLRRTNPSSSVCTECL